MSRPHDIILRPVLTEKTATELEAGKIVFRVRRDATKYQIKEAMRELFGVRVSKVNTLIMPGKPKRWGRLQGRRAPYKKAIIKLAEGENLDLFALGQTIEGEEAGEE